MQIKILPQELINKIAAGEVVERPSSVVKELIENAIDGQAKNISVEIENGGMNLVKVTDDGLGMSREDAKLATLEHATSKISSEDDLFNISTLGFRGEALSSIAAVSCFNLITRDKESLAGTSVTVETGRIEFADIGAPVGTSVIVKDLFYNVPARLKYLKTAVTEFNHVVDLFLNYCLAYPEISWKLSHNRKLIYQFPASELKERVGDVLGDEVVNNLISVDARLNNICVQGFIGKPQIGRNNRKLQFLSVNRRPVSEFIVAKQIKDAFAQLLPKEMYPVYILNLTILNEEVDVNVHPRKLEVRFSEPSLVYRAVYQIVANALDENNLTKKVLPAEARQFVPINELISPLESDVPVSIKQTKILPAVPPSTFSSARKADSASSIEDVGNAYMRSVPKTADTSSIVPRTANVAEFRVLGQVQNSYIVVETNEGIKIFDQHAVSERVQYEKIKREWQIGKMASQKMLVPQNIELTPTEARLVNDNIFLFEKMGFEIADFGSNTFAVSAVPRILTEADTKEIILLMLSELTETLLIDDFVSEPAEAIFRMMACKSAIKFNDALSLEGMEALIRDLEKSGNEYTCVHGRPCAVEFSFDDIKKMFRRK
ncbi:DNA mismatch repair endonuclease MutL [Candidatus Falkowbacteria bacterium]|nr:DNA mismatch repair endonuclease MutL [Candidatus Falkowbacteria bacterium]